MTVTRLNPDSDSSTETSIFTPANGMSVSEVSFKRYGKVAMIQLRVKHTAAWSVGTQYNIGSVASGYRPQVDAAGAMGSAGGALLMSGGTVYVRPHVSDALAANSETYVRFTYLL